MYPNRTDPNSGSFIHGQTRSLAQAGCEVKIISPAPYAPQLLCFNEKWEKYAAIPYKDDIDGLPVLYPRFIRVPGKWFHSYSCYTMYFGINGLLSRIIEAEKPDILHAHMATTDGYVALLLRKRFNLPVVCSLRGSDINIYPFRDRRTMNFTKKVLAEADQIISVSHALKRVAESFLKPKREIKVVYNGCDADLFSFNKDYRIKSRKKLGIPMNAKVLVFVGRLQINKGIYELANAFITLAQKYPELHLILIGSGPESEKIKCDFSSWSLQKKVHFLGSVPHGEVCRWLNAADLFLLPSYNEGLPNAILEAMACKLPIIATRTGGIPEAVEEGNTGMLIDLERDNLDRAISCLLKNESLARQMGENGRKRVEGEFSWRRNAEKTIGVYQQLHGKTHLN